jgi:hypothetical protein
MDFRRGIERSNFEKIKKNTVLKFEVIAQIKFKARVCGLHY